MPELPDVEGFRRVVVEHALGRPVRDVVVFDPGILHGVSPEDLALALRGRRLARADRHGKWLLLSFPDQPGSPDEDRPDEPAGGAPAVDAPSGGDGAAGEGGRARGGPVLALHFGMTGSLRWQAPPDRRRGHRHDRVRIVLDEGELRFRDQRKLQGIWLAEDERGVDELLAGQGPDAATLDFRDFDARLPPSRRAVKAALIDQGVLAGIGNLLADEMLWRAGIHPDRSLARLTPSQRRTLHRQLRRLLPQAVKAGRVPDKKGWLTGLRDQPDAACPVCGTALEHSRTAGRSSLWCPRCQPPG
ncbi:Fpg/Nei family DNA glycosylase [Actinoalloteichus spitiensis]|uniref:Fpg/Nei family DNA glycosylase n=1 Tax=Actinoalloteichus spitiensis TaxID=252394 RepID=UPI00036C1DA7|nr:DNA-formamidopyrimidine glycosylase family protein [Actinoalloteichus spitiensis]